MLLPLLKQKIEEVGVKIVLKKSTKEIIGSDTIKGFLFEDGTKLDVDMVVISAGIRPYDEIAKKTI